MDTEIDHLRTIGYRWAAMRSAFGYGQPGDYTTAVMALDAVHAGPCPLALALLAKAKDADLAHDVSGLLTHYDVHSNTLGGCFAPRYALANHPTQEA
jgi:hypothetical protein